MSDISKRQRDIAKDKADMIIKIRKAQILGWSYVSGTCFTYTTDNGKRIVTTIIDLSE